MSALRRSLFLALLCLALPSELRAAEQPASQPAWSWYEVDAKQNVKVNLYLFWSKGCSHCEKALEFTKQLKERHAWLNIYEYEITTSKANLERYEEMARSLRRVAGNTPAFFYCKALHIGYVSYNETGAYIEKDMQRWYEALQKYYRERSASSPGAPLNLLAQVPRQVPEESPAGLPPDLPVELPPAEEKVTLPGVGTVEIESWSLPTLTVVLAGCDAFNPCAFFVLLLLLSLLVHGHSRLRMLLVGGTFVFFSGLLYFLFMAAWLNLFFLVGHLQAITLAAGVIAVGAAVLNIKDYFWLKHGPSLSLPESVRPGLFQRMTLLIQGKSLPSLLIGTAALACAANTYELLCTAGFPMVYTRVLTLRELPALTYYFYLAIYNVIYVLPLAAIVTIFAWTLGGRKLSETEGRILKLLSGMMMLALGMVLLVRPQLLQSLLGAVALLAAAFGTTALVVAIDSWRRGHPRKASGTTVAARAGPVLRSSAAATSETGLKV